MDDPILAIDLGKFNSVCCWYEPASKAATFRSTRTTRAELEREMRRLPVSCVVIEACSPAGWIRDTCSELGLRCLVANTTGAAWQWKNVKRKTDRDDALKLARLAAIGELPTVSLPSRPVRQWKSLIGLRKRLVGERGRAESHPRPPGRPGAGSARGKQSLDRVGAGRPGTTGQAAARMRSRGTLAWRVDVVDRAASLCRGADSRSRISARCVGKAFAGGATAPERARRRCADGGSDRDSSAPGTSLPKRRTSQRLRGSGATAISERPERSPRANHPTWPETAACGAGRVRLVQSTLQRLGAGPLASSARQRPDQEEGGRGAGAEASHPLLGHLEDRSAVAQSTDGGHPACGLRWCQASEDGGAAGIRPARCDPASVPGSGHEGSGVRDWETFVDRSGSPRSFGRRIWAQHG